MGFLKYLKFLLIIGFFVGSQTHVIGRQETSGLENSENEKQEHITMHQYFIRPVQTVTKTKDNAGLSPFGTVDFTTEDTYNEIKIKAEVTQPKDDFRSNDLGEIAKELDVNTEAETDSIKTHQADVTANGSGIEIVKNLQASNKTHQSLSETEKNLKDISSTVTDTIPETEVDDIAKEITIKDVLEITHNFDKPQSDVVNRERKLEIKSLQNTTANHFNQPKDMKSQNINIAYDSETFPNVGKFLAKTKYLKKSIKESKVTAQKTKTVARNMDDINVNEAKVPDDNVTETKAPSQNSDLKLVGNFEKNLIKFEDISDDSKENKAKLPETEKIKAKTNYDTTKKIKLEDPNCISESCISESSIFVKSSLNSLNSNEYVTQTDDKQPETESISKVTQDNNAKLTEINQFDMKGYPILDPRHILDRNIKGLGDSTESILESEEIPPISEETLKESQRAYEIPSKDIQPENESGSKATHDNNAKPQEKDALDKKGTVFLDPRYVLNRNIEDDLTESIVDSKRPKENLRDHSIGYEIPLEIKLKDTNGSTAADLIKKIIADSESTVYDSPNGIQRDSVHRNVKNLEDFESPKDEISNLSEVETFGSDEDSSEELPIFLDFGNTSQTKDSESAIELETSIPQDISNLNRKTFPSEVMMVYDDKPKGHALKTTRVSVINDGKTLGNTDDLEIEIRANTRKEDTPFVSQSDDKTIDNLLETPSKTDIKNELSNGDIKGKSLLPGKDLEAFPDIEIARKNTVARDLDGKSMTEEISLTSELNESSKTSTEDILENVISEVEEERTNSNEKKTSVLDEDSSEELSIFLNFENAIHTKDFESTIELETTVPQNIGNSKRNMMDYNDKAKGQPLKVTQVSVLNDGNTLGNADDSDIEIRAETRKEDAPFSDDKTIDNLLETPTITDTKHELSNEDITSKSLLPGKDSEASHDNEIAREITVVRDSERKSMTVEASITSKQNETSKPITDDILENVTFEVEEETTDSSEEETSVLDEDSSEELSIYLDFKDLTQTKNVESVIEPETTVPENIQNTNSNMMDYNNESKSYPLKATEVSFLNHGKTPETRITTNKIFKETIKTTQLNTSKSSFTETTEAKNNPSIVIKESIDSTKVLSTPIPDSNKPKPLSEILSKDKIPFSTTSKPILESQQTSTNQNKDSNIPTTSSGKPNRTPTNTKTDSVKPFTATTSTLKPIRVDNRISMKIFNTENPKPPATTSTKTVISRTTTAPHTIAAAVSNQSNKEKPRPVTSKPLANKTLPTRRPGQHTWFFPNFGGQLLFFDNPLNNSNAVIRNQTQTTFGVGLLAVPWHWRPLNYTNLNLFTPKRNIKTTPSNKSGEQMKQQLASDLTVWNALIHQNYTNKTGGLFKHIIALPKSNSTKDSVKLPKGKLSDGNNAATMPNNTQVLHLFVPLKFPFHKNFVQNAGKTKGQQPAIAQSTKVSQLGGSDKLHLVEIPLNTKTTAESANINNKVLKEIGNLKTEEKPTFMFELEIPRPIVKFMKTMMSLMPDMN